MYQIDMEKFGSFLMTLRKEKNLTQKELGERLFVSDKTVSKWERGQSIPNVSLLIPIADLFGITVTELLKGERIQNAALTLEEIEELVAGSVQLSAQEQDSPYSLLPGTVFFPRKCCLLTMMKIKSTLFQTECFV